MKKNLILSLLFFLNVNLLYAGGWLPDLIDSVKPTVCYIQVYDKEISDALALGPTLALRGATGEKLEDSNTYKFDISFWDNEKINCYDFARKTIALVIKAKCIIEEKSQLILEEFDDKWSQIYYANKTLAVLFSDISKKHISKFDPHTCECRKQYYVSARLNEYTGATSIENPGFSVDLCSPKELAESRYESAFSDVRMCERLQEKH